MDALDYHYKRRNYVILFIRKVNNLTFFGQKTQKNKYNINNQ